MYPGRQSYTSVTALLTRTHSRTGSPCTDRRFLNGLSQLQPVPSDLVGVHVVLTTGYREESLFLILLGTISLQQPQLANPALGNSLLRPDAISLILAYLVLSIRSYSLGQNFFNCRACFGSDMSYQEGCFLSPYFGGSAVSIS